MADMPQTTQTPADVAEVLQDKFPGAITPDTREGYTGFVVESDKLVEVATSLRDDLGYDLMSSLNYVDYLEEGFFEVVYNAYNTNAGGPGINFKARTPRDVATLPSLTGVWKSADFQEREAWDLMGIRFDGHYNLKRILMWDGFEGHPLRKDWKEAYYEEDAKPFDSRWPGGHHRRAEDRVTYADNVTYPANFDPAVFTAQEDAAVYARMKTVEVGEHGE